MKKVFTAGAVLVTLALVAVGVYNQQWIRDEYTVKTAVQQPASEALAADIDLTDRAAFIYKASQPQVHNADEFNQACRNVIREQSIVLGCYATQQIHIYNVVDTRLDGVKQVTAAHELLHGVYQRMSNSEKQEVNKLLESTAASITDQRFIDTLAQYRRTEPDQVDNELHSIIGTEIQNIPDALEKHYQKYFNNRQKIVGYSKQYEQTFTQLASQIKDYDTQLSTLKTQKEDLEASLNTRQSSIESDSTQLAALKASGDIDGYNSRVPAYNVKIKTYNNDIDRLKQIVADYNAIVEKRNQLATTQNDLVQHLNSTYQPLN